MKKIILMFGLLIPFSIFAQTGITVKSSTQTKEIEIKKIDTISPVEYNPICASNAVIEHENAQQLIIDNKQSSLKTASIVRRDALGTAYLLTDKNKRDEAIKVARDTFLSSQKSADKKAMELSKKENKLFKTKMDECGAKLPPLTRDQLNNLNGFDNEIGVKQPVTLDIKKPVETIEGSKPLQDKSILVDMGDIDRDPQLNSGLQPRQSDIEGQKNTFQQPPIYQGGQDQETQNQAEQIVPKKKNIFQRIFGF